MRTAPSDTETEWLKQAAQGDEGSFTRLFEAYHQKLGAYVFRLTGSRELAKDIVQDVFLKIWMDREVLANVRRFGAYLYVLSRNRTYNCLRRIAREQVRNQAVVRQIVQQEACEQEEYDYDRLLDQAVQQLPPQQRRAYLLSRRQRLKYAEVALQMGISLETVKKYIKLASHSVSGYVRTHREELSIVAALACQATITAMRSVHF